MQRVNVRDKFITQITLFCSDCGYYPKCTLTGFAENFANLCTEKLKSTHVDNEFIKDIMQAL